jgi:hypothetical protein
MKCSQQRKIKTTTNQQTAITEAAVTPLCQVGEATQAEKFSDSMKNTNWRKGWNKMSTANGATYYFN